jgi:integrase
MKEVEGKIVREEIPDCPMPLVLRITSGSKVSRKNTGLYIRADEWDAKKRQVSRKHPEYARLNDALLSLIREAEGLKADAIRNRTGVAPGQIMKQVFASQDFYEAAESYGKSKAKYNTAKSFTALVTLLKEFAPTLMINEITPQFLADYKAFLQSKGKAHNTIITHLGRIRTVLRSVDLKGQNPFNKFTIGMARPAKSPELTMEDIQQLVDYVPKNRGEANARDTFLFSFYAAGMRSTDVLQLQWADIQKDRIRFDPNKTLDSSRASLSIPLNEVTRSILEGRDKTTKTVFNLVQLIGDSKDAVKARGRVQGLINGSLKVISMNTIKKPLNFKMARTAFAQIANEASQRNVYGIQQAMGHSKISTTEIYLGADARAVDELLAAVYR